MIYDFDGEIDRKEYSLEGMTNTDGYIFMMRVFRKRKPIPIPEQILLRIMLRLRIPFRIPSQHELEDLLNSIQDYDIGTSLAQTLPSERVDRDISIMHILEAVEIAFIQSVMTATSRDEGRIFLERTRVVTLRDKGAKWNPVPPYREMAMLSANKTKDMSAPSSNWESLFDPFCIDMPAVCGAPMPAALIIITDNPIKSRGVGTPHYSEDIKMIGELLKSKSFSDLVNC